MVKKVLTMVHKEIRGLHQAAYILAIFTFGSQLLALIRDRLLAHEFGAHMELDLYYTAFRIPDALYVLFASTLSIYVLIPFLSRRIGEGGKRYGAELLSQFLSLFTLLYGALAFIAILYTEPLVAYLFPGFVSHTEILVPLIRILLLQPFLLGVSSLFGVVTQVEHRFILYAISPILYNIGIIVGLLVLYPVYGIEGLVYGVILGALMHVCICDHARVYVIMHVCMRSCTCVCMPTHMP
jgi:putative peptidoglycan lipid II flippase